MWSGRKGRRPLAGSPQVRGGLAGSSGRKVTVRPRSAPESGCSADELAQVDEWVSEWGMVACPTLSKDTQDKAELLRGCVSRENKDA